MKQIAKTLRNLLDNPVVVQALDRSQPVGGLVEEVQSVFLPVLSEPEASDDQW